MPQFNAQNLEGRDRLGHIEEYISTNKSDWFVRQQIAANAQGVTYQPYDRSLLGGQSALTSQTQYYALVGMRQGDTISNILVDVTTGGSSVSFAQGAVYLSLPTTGGAFLASTANANAITQITGGGVAVLSLANSYTATTDQGVFLSFWCQAGTPPQLVRQGAPGIGGGQVSGFARTYSQQASQTSLASSVTSTSGGGVFFWIGGS